MSGKNNLEINQLIKPNKMKKPILLIYIFICARTLFAEINNEYKIGTYNVRIDIKSDTATRSWSFRKEFVSRIIIQNDLDILGVQELINVNQENELTSMLSAYAFLSKGRDNNEGTSGERLAILYKKNKFELINQGFFFLSETPDLATKGWDANLNRICMYGKFKDIKSNRTFFVFNTHFDHIGYVARENSAALVTEKIKSIAGQFPVFCLGDFNASPTETNFYQQMTTLLTDSKNESKYISGSNGTFNGWDNTKTDFPIDVLIDYIFTSNVQVNYYRVITDRTDKQTYPSDHFPVLISCKLKQPY